MKQLIALVSMLSLFAVAGGAGALGEAAYRR